MRIKRLISILLVLCLSLTACTDKTNLNNNTFKKDTDEYTYKEIIPDFTDLNDTELLQYVEDKVYLEAVSNLDSEKYFVENVSAVYLSKEYLEELEFNSKTNVYFGYSLADILNTYEKDKYIFTVDENGKTIVTEFTDYDDTYNKALKKVAIGTGVILICVTVSVVTGGAGAPAISMVFAVSAKTGALMALSSGTIGAVSSGIVTGIETKDFDKTVKAAAEGGADGFMWGAIVGTISGGISETKLVHALKGADVTANGLSLKEAAKIQKKSKYPLDIIKQFKSMDEYKVYQESGLVVQMVNGKTALVQKIDLGFKSTLSDGTEVTNLERMARGLAPIDSKTLKPYELHHIGQKNDATLAVLTNQVHKEYSSILHVNDKVSEIDRPKFETIKKNFWKAIAKNYGA